MSDPSDHNKTPGGMTRIKRWLHRLSWCVIPLALIAVLGIGALDLRTSYEFPFLLTVLNFIFFTLASLFVASLLGQYFLANGSPGVLFLIGGAIAWGTACLVAAGAGMNNINLFVTLHNCIVWFAALCQLAGGILMLWHKRTLQARPVWLAAACIAPLGIIGLIALAGVAGWTPVFFTQGSGGTLMRQLVLGSTVVMFFLTTLLLRAVNRRSPSSFVRWYMIALALLAIGLLGVMMENSLGDVLSWTGRGVQYLGGIYMAISALAASRESRRWRVWTQPVLAVALASLAAIGWFSYRNALAMIDADRREDQTDTLRLEYDRLLLALMGTETGVRGFIIAGDRNFLEPYEEGLRIVELKLISLKSLTAGNSVQQQKLTELEPLIRKKLAFLKESIAVRSSQGWAAASARVSSGLGKQTMDEIRRKVNEAQADLILLLDAQKTAKANDTRRVLRTLPIGGLFAGLLLITVFLVLQREIQRRFTAETELREHRDHLQELVAAQVMALEQTNTDLKKEIEVRHQVEQELRKSERLYRAIGESIDYGVWVCDEDGRNIYASESFLKLVGLTQEQCSDFGWGEVLHPEDARRTLEKWRECVRTGAVWDIEHRFHGADGQWHDVLARGVPVCDEQGQVICWAGINLDIGKLKQSAQALRLSEERFRSLFEKMTEGFALHEIICDPAGNPCDYRFLEVNPAFEQLTGLTRLEVVGKTAGQLLPNEAPQWVQVYGQVALSGVPLHFDHYSPALKRHYDIYGFCPARGQFAVLFTDISEFKRAQKQIEHLASFPKLNPNPIVELDAQGTITYYMPPLCTF